MKVGDKITIGGKAAESFSYQMAVGLTAVILDIDGDKLHVTLGGLNSLFIHVDDALPLVSYEEKALNNLGHAVAEIRKTGRKALMREYFS